MLTGLCRCALCQRAACYQGSGGRAYVCNHAPVRGTDDPEQHSIRFRAEIAERLVAQAVQGALTGPEAIRAAVEEYRASQESMQRNDGARERLHAAEKALADVRRRQAAAVRMQIEAAADGRATDLYTTELRRLSREESEAATDVSAARASLSGSEGDRHGGGIDADTLLAHTACLFVGVEAVLLDQQTPGSIKNAALRDLVEAIWLHPNPEAARWAKREEKASPARVDVVFRSFTPFAGKSGKGGNYTPYRDRGNSSLPRLIVSVAADGSIRFAVAVENFPAAGRTSSRDSIETGVPAGV